MHLARKEEQRSQHATGRLNRVRSAFTRLVSLFKAKTLYGHWVFQRKKSAQLRLLGLTYWSKSAVEQTSLRPAIFFR
jgi:hypothetical protein